MATDKEVSKAFGRFNLAVRTLESLITGAEERNINDKRWFIFADKVGRKLLTQAYTLQHIFEHDIYFVKKDVERRFVDFHSMFVLLRALLETYAVFFHLFADKCSFEEKIVRFRLWELDGLQSRQKREPPVDSITKQKLESEKIDIENCIDLIKQFDYFKQLDPKTQQFLIEKAAWRFTDSSIKNKDNNKKRLSIEEMTLNTGIQKALFDGWYSFTSTHVHTTYWSVIQSDTLIDEERIIAEYVAIMQATFICSFLLRISAGFFNMPKTNLNGYLQLKRTSSIHSTGMDVTDTLTEIRARKTNSIHL